MVSAVVAVWGRPNVASYALMTRGTKLASPKKVRPGELTGLCPNRHNLSDVEANPQTRQMGQFRQARSGCDAGLCQRRFWPCHRPGAGQWQASGCQGHDGFWSAGVLEVVEDPQGDTHRASTPSSSPAGSMSCTAFRRSPKAASPRRNRIDHHPPEGRSRTSKLGRHSKEHANE